MNRNEFLKALTVKQDTIKLETLEDMEVTIKELTLNENAKVEEVRKKVIAGELDNMALLIETCRYAMVEPQFFSDEELQSLSRTGVNVLTEIYMRLPEIGMSEDQKKIYKERLAESLSKEVEKLTEEEVEKKPRKKNGSSLD